MATSHGTVRVYDIPSWVRPSAGSVLAHARCVCIEWQRFEIVEKTHSHGCFGGDRGSVLDFTCFLEYGLMWCVASCIDFPPDSLYGCLEKPSCVRTCPKGSVVFPLHGGVSVCCVAPPCPTVFYIAVFPPRKLFRLPMKM